MKDKVTSFFFFLLENRELFFQQKQKGNKETKKPRERERKRESVYVSLRALEKLRAEIRILDRSYWSMDHNLIIPK